MSLKKRALVWRNQRRRVIGLEFSARALGWGLAVAGVMAEADHWMALSRALRVAVWLAGATALLVHAWLGLVALWRTDWEAIFTDAARLWPVTRPMFSSAWALGIERAGGGESEQLRCEHIARTDALAAGLSDAPLYAWIASRTARFGVVAAVVALAFSIGVRGSWTRVLAPWLDAPLDNLVVLLPGNATVDWGASVFVAAKLTPEGVSAGLRGGDLALELRSADGAWRGVKWDAADGDSASFETGALVAALDYRARHRDRVTRSQRLLAVPVPRFQDAQAIVRGTHGAKTFVLGRDAPVRARRGDWVTVRAGAQGALVSAALRLSTLPVPLAMREVGGSWSTGFLAQEDAIFSFLLVSADLRRDPSPPTYSLSVLADAKPSVEMLSPQAPLQAGPRDSITIAYAARDDGELTRLELVIAPKISGMNFRRTLDFKRGSAETLGDLTLKLRDYAPGTIVEFWLEAVDDASPPQSARSEKGSVEIVDVDAAHTLALAAREKALGALDRAATAAEKAAAGESEEAVREAASPVAGLWSTAVGALMAWNELMRADPRANQGLADQASAAAESLAAAGMEGLPKADAALKEHDLARAAREQTALAAQARAAAAALREGSSVQNAQDMADRAFDADQGGRDLKDLTALLKEKITPAEAAELEKALAAVDAALAELEKSISALPEASSETSSVRELPLEGARDAASALRRALQNGDAAGAERSARELAEKLARVSKGLRESGRRAGKELSGRARESAGRVAAAWREAAARQEKSVEITRRRENARLAGKVRAQKELLLRSRDAIDSALASAPSLETERSAREARADLAAGQIDAAVRLLRIAAGQARQAALSDHLRSPAHEATAKALDDAAVALEHGVDGARLDPVAAHEAADFQALARESAGRLRREVSSAAGLLGYLLGGSLRRIDDAMSEQEAGTQALRRGDVSEGLRFGEAALKILQDGDKSASGAESGASMLDEALSRAFEMPGSVVRRASKGTRGSAMGKVRLPSADEYRPPQELREELERSLHEPRPAAHDSAIKEYFRRLIR